MQLNGTQQELEDTHRSSSTSNEEDCKGFKCVGKTLRGDADCEEESPAKERSRASDINNIFGLVIKLKPQRTMFNLTKDLLQEKSFFPHKRWWTSWPE
ncbi:Protein atonal-like protein 7-A [Frankliniella fusca]|uniref:Protein atonal-like protein 7-A n=1 Tax=Frankliniella fusca TaxID=407009 RepID=A0AAE1HS47_9NEOP|nr:Protein atonal-like protein 7-A [Frankliniella fusca]